MVPAPRIESPSFRSPGFWSVTAWRSSATTSGASAARAGDWNTASYDDLAGDVIAAFEYLKTRSDIDSSQIGLLGVSQAGWIMPLAAVRAKDLAFLISISGAGIPGAETTIDQARNEMTALGMKPQIVADIVELMKLQYRIRANRPGMGSVPGSP